MGERKIIGIGGLVCPVCGGKAVQRKSIAACVIVRSIPHYDLKWKCMQCEMNFSAAAMGRDVLSRRADYEEQRDMGIDILGSSASRRGEE